MYSQYSQSQRYKYEPQDSRQNLNINLACPDCKSAHLIEHESDGDMVCGDCGLVLADRMPSLAAEWRNFQGDTAQTDNSRVGGPSDRLTGLSDFSTLIGRSSDYRLTNSLRKAAEHTHKTEEQNQAGFAGIEEKCAASNLPIRVMDAAQKMYEKVQKKQLLRGKPTEWVEAGCIYWACEQQGVTRSIRELANSTGVSHKHIGTCHSIISRATLEAIPAKLKAANSRAASATHTTGVSTSNSATETVESSQLQEAVGVESEKLDDQILRGCNYTGLPPSCARYVRKIFERQDKLGLLGSRTPSTVIGAILYMVIHAIGREATYAWIGELMHISGTTIKAAYKILYNHSDQLLEGLTGEDGNEALNSELLPAQ